jgi:hypothetical protein
MEIMFTLHARQRMMRRKILSVWVEEAVRSPDSIRHIGNKYYATKRLNGAEIKVVFVKEKFIKIITTFYVK